MSLLVTRVLGDKVEVLSSDNDGSVHLGGNDGAGQDTATDGNGAGERALLVYIAQSQQFQFARGCVPVRVSHLDFVALLDFSVSIFCHRSFDALLKLPTL